MEGRERLLWHLSPEAYYRCDFAEQAIEQWQFYFCFVNQHE